MNTKELSLLLLGFSEDSNPTEDDIKKAFRKVAQVLHPDGGGTAEQFRGLTLAKDLLLSSAPTKKKAETKAKTEQKKRDQAAQREEYKKTLEKEIWNHAKELVSWFTNTYPRFLYLYLDLDNGVTAVLDKDGNNISLRSDNQYDDEIQTRELLLGVLGTLALIPKYWKYQDVVRVEFERRDLYYIRKVIKILRKLPVLRRFA